MGCKLCRQQNPNICNCEFPRFMSMSLLLIKMGYQLAPGEVHLLDGMSCQLITGLTWRDRPPIKLPITPKVNKWIKLSIPSPFFPLCRWGAGLRKQHGWETEERQLSNPNEDGANWALETHRGLSRRGGLWEGWQALCRPQVSRKQWREACSDHHRTTREGKKTGKLRKDSVCAPDKLTWKSFLLVETSSVGDLLLRVHHKTAYHMFWIHEALMETNETLSVCFVLNIQIDYLILLSNLLLNKSGSFFFRCGMVMISVTLPHKKDIQINICT